MTETKTNISYNPSLAAVLASNLLFIYSAQRITLVPETPGISAEQAPLWEAHNSQAAGGGLPAVCCRKGCDFPPWFLCICRGITPYSWKQKKGYSAYVLTFFSPTSTCLAITVRSHAGEMSSCLHSSIKNASLRIIPSKLVKSMTRLSLNENVMQNLITFHIGPPETTTA